MSISKKFYPLVIAGLLAFSSASHATTTVYDFGNLLTSSSSTAPNSFATPFAQLSATDTGGGVWNFLLTLNNNLFTSFGTGAFIGSMAFDFTPNPLVKKPVSTFIASNLDGVTSVGTGGAGNSELADIDFGTGFGQGSGNRLSLNDWVEWSVSGLDPISSLTNMYVHVQGMTGGHSAKYTPIVSPVPEPETYAMLLAGLGLIGFSARRRKLNN